MRSAELRELAREAQTYSENADRALRQGDLATYAAEIQKFQAAFRKLRSALEGAPSQE
jgi:hypothetical protein